MGSSKSQFVGDEMSRGAMKDNGKVRSLTEHETIRSKALIILTWLVSNCYLVTNK